MKKILLTILALSLSMDLSASYYGKFNGDPEVKLLKDGRLIELLKDFVYFDPNGMEWNSPKGSIVDGASIPRIVWSIASPLDGKYRNASIIHDVACIKRNRTWEYVHLVFYYAMLASGTDDLTAKLMYAGVLVGGPRWEMKKEIVVPASDVKIASNPKYLAVDLNSEIELVSTEQIFNTQSTKMVFKITPTKKRLSNQQFGELKKVIISRESSKQGPMTIMEIQDYVSRFEK